MSESKNKKQERMIAEAMMQGGNSFCDLVAGVAKGIDVSCKYSRALNLISLSGNAGVLVNDLIKKYNTVQGSFPGGFAGCYGKIDKKRKPYHNRLHRVICNACQNVYSNGNTLAGMEKKEVMCAVELFWELLLK